METANKRTATGDGNAAGMKPRREMSLLQRSSILLGCLLPLEVLLGAVAFSIDGLGGLSATLVALLSSVIGGFLALAISDFLAWLLRDEAVGFAQAVAGMLVRAATGLAVCAISYGFGLWVSSHGLVYYVLVFYMLTLVVETRLALRQLGGVTFAASSAVEN